MNRKPTLFDNKEKVFNYLVNCLNENSIPFDISELEEIWNEGMDKNSQILSYLKALKREVESKGERFKVKAYTTAIKEVEKLQVPIVSGKQARQIKGIGAKIEAKIDEILKTGKLKAVERRLRASIDKQKIIELFMDIWGIGQRTALDFYKKGYRSLNDIDPLNDLNDQQRIGLKYFYEFKQPIPRNEVKDIGDSIQKSLHSLNPNLESVVLGSYRRGAKQSGDVDVLLRLKHQKATNGLLAKCIEKLIEDNIITDILTIGNTKFMGVGISIKQETFGGEIIHRRVDIRLVDSNEWAYSMLYFTGSKTFNIQMREHAKKLGLKLNEKGLFDKKGKLLKADTEKEIFEHLGMKYVPPEQR